MILTLGPDNLSTTLDFTIWKKAGLFTLVNDTIHSPNIKIGVYLSGGLDSAALLCLILAELKTLGKLNDIPVTCFTVDKNDSSTVSSVQVLDQIKKHFNCDIVHVNNLKNDPIPNLEGNIGPNVISQIRNYDPIMILYMGINRMAPPELKTYKHPLKIDYGYNKTSNIPFLFLHKPHIIDILYKLGCEDIIPYTRSCTQVDVGTCGECYACEERAWGFEMLGKTDPSKIII
jgi:hypothetical protein